MDLISRQAAIDALDGKIEITGRTKAVIITNYISLVKDRIEQLPSAQPERKKGKLEVCGTFDDFLKCSCCGYKKPWNEDIFNFCPNCGAEMEKNNAKIC